MCGSTGSFGSGGDIYLVKTDESGVREWSNYLGGPGAQASVACGVSQDGFIVAGSTGVGSFGGYDMLLVKIDQTGSIDWSRSFGGPDWDLCNDMAVLSDGFVMAGLTYSFGSADGDGYLVRTDFDGEVIWTRFISTPGFDEALGVDVDQFDNIIVSGVVMGEFDPEDAFVNKYTSSGELIWSTTFGGDSADHVSSVALASDGGYVAIGGTSSYSTVPQVLVHKLDINGGSVWQREYGTAGVTVARKAVARNGGGVAMVGYNTVSNAGGQDMFLIQLDDNGYWILGKNYGSESDEEGYGIDALDDGGFVMAGVSDNYGPGISAMYVVRCAANGETEDDTVYPYVDPVSVPELDTVLFGIAPNPSSGNVSFLSDMDFDKLLIFDVQGQLVEEHLFDQAKRSVSLEVSSGFYLMKFFSRSSYIGSSRLQILR